MLRLYDLIPNLEIKYQMRYFWRGTWYVVK